MSKDKNKDKQLVRIKAIKRASRIELGGIGGKAGVHVEKKRRRMRRMDTDYWLEEVEQEAAISEEVEMAVYESRLNSDIEQAEKSIVICSMCKSSISVYTAHLHQNKWIGECCWDEQLRTME